MVEPGSIPGYTLPIGVDQPIDPRREKLGFRIVDNLTIHGLKMGKYGVLESNFTNLTGKIPQIINNWLP